MYVHTYVYLCMCIKEKTLIEKNVTDIIKNPGLTLG